MGFWNELKAAVKEGFDKGMGKEHADLPRFDDGTPHVGEVIRIANLLYEDNKDAEAIALLEKCRNECGRLKLISSVQTLSDEIMAMCDRRAADKLAPEVFEILKHHPNGIMQTELYKLMPDHGDGLIRYACYRLAETGKIDRSKKGRSYLLEMPSLTDRHET